MPAPKGFRQDDAIRLNASYLPLQVFVGLGHLLPDGPWERIAQRISILVSASAPHDEAPRVLIANSNLVGQWSNYSEFNRLERIGLTMYGQMTAGSWIYIGSQGIVQGTFETFAEAGRQRFGGSLEGKLVVTGGLGGMGGAQPLAATMPTS